MSNYDKFTIDISRARDLKNSLNAQTNIIVNQTKNAQHAMEKNNTNDPIMLIIGQIAKEYQSFSDKAKAFQRKADSELNSAMSKYSSSLDEGKQLMKNAERKHHF